MADNSSPLSRAFKLVVPCPRILSRMPLEWNIINTFARWYCRHEMLEASTRNASAYIRQDEPLSVFEGSRERGNGAGWVRKESSREMTLTAFLKFDIKITQDQWTSPSMSSESVDYPFLALSHLLPGTQNHKASRKSDIRKSRHRFNGIIGVVKRWWWRHQAK